MFIFSITWLGAHCKSGSNSTKPNGKPAPGNQYPVPEPNSPVAEPVPEAEPIPEGSFQSPESGSPIAEPESPSKCSKQKNIRDTDNMKFPFLLSNFCTYIDKR